MARIRSERTTLIEMCEALGCELNEIKPVAAWDQPGKVEVIPPIHKKFIGLIGTELVTISVEHGGCIGVKKEDACRQASAILRLGVTGIKTKAKNPPIRAKRFVTMLEERREALRECMAELGQKEKGKRMKIGARIAELDLLIMHVYTEFIMAEDGE